MTTATLPRPSEETCRALAELAALEDEIRSSTEDESIRVRKMLALIDAADALAKAEPAPPGCPAWCKSHEWAFDLVDEARGYVENSWHCRRVPVGDDYVEVSQDCEGRLDVTLPETDKRLLGLTEARAIAAAILAACDAIEGGESLPGRSG